MRRGIALWVAVLVPMWVTLTACTAWEPMVYDGWALRIIQRSAPTTHWTNLVEFAQNTYLRGNPRLGQVFAMLLYTPGRWHVIVTPLVLVLLFVLATTLALGRWPSWRRTEDAIAFLVVTALVIVTCPHLGPMLFHRPYLGNYTFPVVLDLALIVPYRFHLEMPRQHHLAAVPAMFVLGAAAGACNEHTGLALGALLVAALVVFARRDRRISAWMIAGVVGLALGYAALLLAPGQHVRYGGLADQQTVFERIATRGVLANLAVVGRLAAHAAAALPWIVLAWLGASRPGAERMTPTARRAGIGLAAAGLIATVTLLASPKLGERLYIVSTVLVAVAVAPWILAATRARTFARLRDALAAILLVVVAACCLHAYVQLGPASTWRQDQIETAPPGSRVVVPPFPCDETWWNLGDDLADPARRESLARRFGLAAIELRRGD